MIHMRVLIDWIILNKISIPKGVTLPQPLSLTLPLPRLDLDLSL